MENTYRKLFNLDFENFYKLVNKYGLDIDQEHLFIIYNLIQNNRYALDDSHYIDVLYNYISEKTSIATCLKIKSFFTDYFKLGLNVWVLNISISCLYGATFSIYGVSSILGTSFNFSWWTILFKTSNPICP